MRLLWILALAPLIASVVDADTIRLRNGTDYEGVVVSEDGDHYVVMVQVSETIRDQRRILKKDVLEIVEAKKDQVAYEKIRDLVPTPGRLDLEEYNARIDKVRTFLKEFSDSRYVRQVTPMLETLDAEREVIAEGGIKFDGRLLDATERKAAAFTLDSQMVAATMDKAIAEGQRIAALRAWDRLQEEFPNSRAYLDGMSRILPVMRAQLAAVDRELETLESRLAKRTANLERVPVKDLARARKAIEERTENFLTLIEAEHEAGIRWTSLDPFEKEPLTKAKSLLESEIRRLEGFDSTRVPDGDGVWAEAWATLTGNPTVDEARDALSKARSAQLPKTYLDMLEARMPAN